MENPLLDALDQLTAEVSACRAAIEANKPEAMTRAVERAAGTIAGDVRKAVEKSKADSEELYRALGDALESSRMARTAALMSLWCIAPAIIISALLGASAGLWEGKRLWQVTPPEQGTAEACQLVQGRVGVDPKSKQQFCTFWLR